MSSQDNRTTALDQAIAVLRANNASALQKLCDQINDPLFNKCLVSMALNANIECLRVVLQPLQGVYDGTDDCFTELSKSNPDREKACALLPYADINHCVKTKDSLTIYLWELALKINAPTSVYTNLNPDSSVVYRALEALAQCEDPDLWAWCLNRVAERHSALNLHGQLGSTWHAALRAKNCVALNALAAHPVSAPAVNTGLLHTFASHWDVWSDPQMVEQITQHAALARHVVSTAIQRNDWSVAHPLIECVDDPSDVAEACLNTKNAFICRWAFSHGIRLTPDHLWEFMRSQVTAPPDVAFFKEMVECDRLWNMGAWSGLIAKHHPTPLFCQAIFYAEELGDLLGSHIDPQWRNSAPLRLATALGHTQTVKKLLPHSTPQELNSQALALAAHRGYQEIVEILLPHSDSRASHHLALACALWRVVDKNASPNVAKMLMTIETSPQHLRETWLAHCADNEYEFDWFEGVMTKWDDGEEKVQDHTTSSSIFGDSPSENNETDFLTMDWEVFDDVVQQWWSFTTPKRIEKMVAVAEKLYPEVLKHHLCDANEKTNLCPARKI